MQQQIHERLAQAGVPVDTAQAAQLAEYLELLRRWNEVHNLTAVTDPYEMTDRHLVESLAFRPYLRGRRVADVGSGAGLPGIPLAIACPEIDFTLIESRGKRVRFLNHVRGTLGLTNVEVIESRVERLTPASRFATVLARAVAAPPKLIELAGHLLDEAGIVLVLTKASYAEEPAEVGVNYKLRIAEDPVAQSLRGALLIIERAEH